MTYKSSLREGIVVGLVGAGVVAIWFFLYDLATGAPFRTPALLGATLFHGLRDPGALVISGRLVAEYTLFHGVAFVAFGIAAALLFALVDQERRVLFAVFMLFCCLEVAALLAMMVLSERTFEQLGPWSMLGANLLASVAMLGVLFRGHRRSPAELLVVGE
jgi:hypothetical protein